jgi:GT2 family glycosyltransferase
LETAVIEVLAGQTDSGHSSGGVIRAVSHHSVSVIVVNMSASHLLDKCLGSLSAQSQPPDEVIVVDNGSSDGSVDLVQARFPHVHLLALSYNAGFSRANNLGIRHARGEYVALLNNDAEPAPGWLGELVAALEANPDIGSCASKIVLHQDPGVVDSCGDSYSVDGTPGKIGHLEPVAESSRPQEVFGACAGAAIYRRSMLEELGGFDEDFFMVYEDSDLSFRARLRGHKCLYVPTAIVRHHVSASLGVLSDDAVYYAQRNLEYVFFQNMPTRLLVKYLPVHVLTNGFRFLAHMARRQTRIFLKAKIDALRNLPRVLEKRRTIQRGRRVSSLEIDALLTRRPLLRMLRQRLHAGAHTRHHRGANH